MKNIFTLRSLIITSLIAVPLIVSAQGSASQGLTSLSGLVNTFTNTIVKSVGTLLATLAMVAFFYGIVQFIWGSREGKAEVMTNGKNFMLWGIIALFIMFSVWGIVGYFQGIFGIQGQNRIVIPSFQFSSSGGGLPVGTNPASSYSLPTGSNPIQTGTNSTQNCNSIASEVQRNACFASQSGGLPTGTNPTLGVGADCVTLGSSQECNAGLTCQNYKCQLP